MNKLFIFTLLLMLILTTGCQSNGCLSEPQLLKSGEVQEVNYIGTGGLVGGTTTIITFIDGTKLALTGTFNINYKKIEIYITCVMAGNYEIREYKETNG